jgi:hypothetical protein
MKTRCTSIKHKQWRDYGGRGISVCDRWQIFENFKDDMYPSYTEGLEIDRIDNNGNYCPENCRWVTHTENNLNKRYRKDSYWVSYKGETHTLAEWSRLLEINRTTLAMRLQKHHWPVEKAFETKKEGAQ